MVSLADTIRTQCNKVINIFHCAVYETKQSTTSSTMNLCPADIVSRNDCIMILWIAASTYITTVIGFNLTIWSMRHNGMTTIFAVRLHLIIFTQLYQPQGNIIQYKLRDAIEKPLASELKVFSILFLG